MTPDAFTAAGRALHGDHWQSALARRLGAHRTQVVRFATGRSRIPDDVAEMVHDMLRDRRIEIDEMLTT